MDANPDPRNRHATSEEHPDQPVFLAEQPKGKAEGEKENGVVTGKRIVDRLLDQLMNIGQFGEWLVIVVDHTRNLRQDFRENKRKTGADDHDPVFVASRKPVAENSESQDINGILSQGVKNGIEEAEFLTKIINTAKSGDIDFSKFQKNAPLICQVAG